MNPLRVLLLAGIRCYRLLISPVLTFFSRPLGMGCRFTPTCSAYAFGAIQQHGAWKGSGLALRRLCRCHPWGGAGHDPVPPASETVQSSPVTSSQVLEASPPEDSPRPHQDSMPLRAGFSSQTR